MNVEFSPRADADLDQIKTHIAADDPGTAQRVIERILQAVAVLGDFPLLGRPGRVEGTREFTISGLPFFAVYHIPTATELVVIAIVHTARNYPEGEGQPVG